MSRSNYFDDIDSWQLIRWRGAVTSAINGARGQAFLKEMLCALDALPEQKLVANNLEQDGSVCAIGAVGRARGVNMTEIDPEDSETVAHTFGVADALACEIAYINDEGSWCVETEEIRYKRVRNWIVKKIKNVGDVG